MRYARNLTLVLLVGLSVSLLVASSVQAGVFDAVKELNESVKEKTALAKDIEKTKEDVKSLGPDEPKKKVKKKSKKKKKKGDASSLDESNWHVSSDGKPIGPMTAAEVGKRISSGSVDAETLVWQEGMDEWVPAGTASRLDKFFARKPPPLPSR